MPARQDAPYRRARQDAPFVLGGVLAEVIYELLETLHVDARFARHAVIAEIHSVLAGTELLVSAEKNVAAKTLVAGQPAMHGLPGKMLSSSLPIVIP